MSKNHFYDVWTQMLQRCNNAHNKRFADYGGRGIKVCDRWADFSLFLSDMGDSYRRGLTLERMDNDGPYSPNNCCWGTNTKQMRNQRKTIRVVFCGQNRSLADLADEYGIKLMTAYGRFKLRGWSIEQTLGIAPPPKPVRSPMSEEQRAIRSASAKRRYARERDQRAGAP